MNVFCRIAVVAVCGFAAWWSGRMAWADWLAASDAPDGLERAVRLEPDDARLVSIQASLKGEVELRRALQLNPWDSGTLMALGIRAEFRGDRTDAERYLVQAASVDRQFKPAWALANYYLRNGQQDRIWPFMDRCLRLDPLGFDPAPLFDLCWNATSDGDKILALIPKKRPRLIEYMGYLIRSERIDAAVQAWPAALSIMDNSKPEDAAQTIPFCALLVEKGRIAAAVSAWDDLVARSVIHSGKLEPEKGVSIADPMFAHMDSGGVFTWQESGPVPGMFVRDLSPAIEFDVDGNQPETLTLLQVLAPVIPGRKYRLQSNVDSSRLSDPRDAAFFYRISQGAGLPPSLCPVLAVSSSCSFATGADVRSVRIELAYSRAPGTVRSKGSLRLSKTALEFAS